MKKLLIVGLILMLFIVGCSDSSPPDVQPTQPVQNGQYVGGGCGLSGVSHENVQVLPKMLYYV